MGLTGSEGQVGRGGGRKLGPGGQAIPGLGQEAQERGADSVRAKTCLSVLGLHQAASLPSCG